MSKTTHTSGIDAALANKTLPDAIDYSPESIERDRLTLAAAASRAMAEVNFNKDKAHALLLKKLESDPQLLEAAQRVMVSDMASEVIADIRAGKVSGISAADLDGQA